MAYYQGIDRRDYGKLEAQVAQLTADVHHLKGTVDQMRDMMQQAKGGWRMVMMISGIAATIGALISWLVSHVRVA